MLLFYLKEQFSINIKIKCSHSYRFSSYFVMSYPLVKRSCMTILKSELGPVAKITYAKIEKWQFKALLNPDCKRL